MVREARRESPRRTSLGALQQLARERLGSALHIAVAGESRGNLGGEQSPWEERAKRRWKRWRIATDSSVEKRPEVGASSGAVLTVPSGNGRCGRRQSVPSACATRPCGLARTVSCSRAAFTRSPTPASAEAGARRVSAAVFGRPPRRWRGRCRSACWSAAYLAPVRRATSVARHAARGDVEGCFGSFEHHRARARTFVPPSHFGVAVRCSHRPRSERVLGSPSLRRRVSSSSGLGRGSVRIPLPSLRRRQTTTPASVGAVERAPVHFGVRVLAGPGVSSEPGLGQGGRRPTAGGQRPQ